MGLFDSISKMFGRGSSAAQQQPNAQQRFESLRQKYQTALNVADQQQLQFHNLQLQDDKLYVRATAPSEEARDKFWTKAGCKRSAAGEAMHRDTRSSPAIRFPKLVSSFTAMQTSTCAYSMLTVIS